VASTYASSHCHSHTTLVTKHQISMTIGILPDQYDNHVVVFGVVRTQHLAYISIQTASIL